jgi:hypothetical protein
VLKKVGDVFAAEFESIRFTPRWIDMPEEFK